jgi:hypothetical protein
VDTPKPIEFAYDYSQLYLYDAETDFDADRNLYLDALDAATATGLSVGACSGLVDILMPRQENFGASMTVHVLTDEPAVRDPADHIVEFHVALPSGRLVLEGSGGSGREELQLPPGAYRARLTGDRFDAAARWSYADAGYPGDRYSLELWLAEDERPPTELRRWSGYANRL